MVYETALMVTPDGSESAKLTTPSGPVGPMRFELQFTATAPPSSATAAAAVILAVFFISVSSSESQLMLATIRSAANLCDGRRAPSQQLPSRRGPSGGFVWKGQ